MIAAISVLIFGLVFAVNAQSCTNNDVATCLQPIFALNLDQGYTAASLNAACPVVQQVDSCLSRKRCTDSNQSVRLAWVGLRDALNYMCGPGRQILINSNTCLKSAAVTQGINRCTAASQTAAANANSNADKCRVINAAITCMTNSVTSTCGRDAGRALGTVTAKILQPTMSVAVPGCTINTPYQAVMSRQLQAKAIKNALNSFKLVF